MEPVHPSPRQREVLTDQVAQRILARAAELDAAQKAAVDVANLRAAAVEAGISPSAFDSALDEVRSAEQLPAASPRRRRPRIRMLLLAVPVFMLAGAFVVGRMVMPVPLPLSEQAFLLRCLAPGEAAALIRPILGPRSAVLVGPSAPRILTLRGTREHIAEIGAILDARDVAACAAPATTR